MCLAQTYKGDQLLTFYDDSTFTIPPGEETLPLTFALAAAEYQGKLIFVYNKGRQEWELPGGMIDTGEHPQETARRELAEESGQQAQDIRQLGWIKCKLVPDRFMPYERVELGALYGCRLETLAPFTENDEIFQMVLWDMESAIEGTISEIDRWLGKHALQCMTP